MKPIIAPALCALAVTAASGAFAQSCRGTTQVDANFCAKAGWEDADRELNRLWRLLKPRADAEGWGKSLLNEQRAWLKRRDAVCDVELKSGGSAAPMFFWTCMDKMTRSRNDEFRSVLR